MSHETAETASPSTPEVESGPNRSRALLVAVGLLLAGVAATVVTGIPVALSVGALGYGLESNAFVVGVFVANALGFVLVAGVYLRRWSGGVRVALPRGELVFVAGATVISLSFALVAEVVYAYLGGPASSSLVGDAIAVEPLFVLTYAALSVLVIAPAEELLFRGAIQRRLARAFGARGAIIGASLLFAAPHAFNFAGGYLTGLFAAGTLFVVSLAWGWAYDRTDNLLVPILIHGLYNAGLAAVAYLSVTSVV